MNTLETATARYAAADPTGVARNQGRIVRLARILEIHPDARVEFCSDERTGRRYGRAACRRDRCEKLGNTAYKNQCWAVWS